MQKCEIDLGRIASYIQALKRDIDIAEENLCAVPGLDKNAIAGLRKAIQDMQDAIDLIVLRK